MLLGGCCCFGSEPVLFGKDPYVGRKPMCALVRKTIVWNVIALPTFITVISPVVITILTLISHIITTTISAAVLAQEQP